MDQFSIQNYTDGRPTIYGNAHNVDIEEAMESLYGTLAFRNKTEEEIEEFLENMKQGYVMKGDRFSEIKITKH